MFVRILFSSFLFFFSFSLVASSPDGDYDDSTDFDKLIENMALGLQIPNSKYPSYGYARDLVFQEDKYTYDWYHRRLRILRAKNVKIDTKKEENNCDEILPGVYVGNAKSIKDCIDNDLVDCIISFNPRHRKLIPTEFKGKVITLPYGDSKNTSLQQAYNDSKDAMRSYKKGLLIHCAKGHSRSVSLCAYVIMKHYKVTYSVAIQYMRTKRPSCNPNMWFESQLIDFGKEINYIK